MPLWQILFSEMATVLSCLPYTLCNVNLYQETERFSIPLKADGPCATEVVLNQP